MIQFDLPENINGAELLQELRDAGVTIESDPRIDGNGDFWLDIAEVDSDKAAPIVAAHNGTTIAPAPTLEAKLAIVGLSVNDLKTALGL